MSDLPATEGPITPAQRFYRKWAIQIYRAQPALQELLKDVDRNKEPFMTPEQYAALTDYWKATTHAEEHDAYVRYLRAGGEAAYGESPEEVERIKNCPDCLPDVPLSGRGFGV